jgi:hypothetical protein
VQGQVSARQPGMPEVAAGASTLAAASSASFSAGEIAGKHLLAGSFQTLCAAQGSHARPLQRAGGARWRRGQPYRLDWSTTAAPVPSTRERPAPGRPAPRRALPRRAPSRRSLSRRAPPGLDQEQRSACKTMSRRARGRPPAQSVRSAERNGATGRRAAYAHALERRVGRCCWDDARACVRGCWARAGQVCRCRCRCRAECQVPSVAPAQRARAGAGRRPSCRGASGVCQAAAAARVEVWTYKKTGGAVRCSKALRCVCVGVPWGTSK